MNDCGRLRESQGVLLSVLFQLQGHGGQDMGQRSGFYGGVSESCCCLFASRLLPYMACPIASQLLLQLGERKGNI